MKLELSAWIDQEEERSRPHLMPCLEWMPASLLANLRIGEQLFEFEQREVRCILVRQYEMRYEIQRSIIYLLRLWHTRQDR